MLDAPRRMPVAGGAHLPRPCCRPTGVVHWRDASAAHGGQIPTFFGGAVGIGARNMSVSSTAIAQNFDIKGLKSSGGGNVSLLPIVLDKAAYDDFERGDDDRYSVPIGDATRDGLTVGDIDRAVDVASGVAEVLGGRGGQVGQPGGQDQPGEHLGEVRGAGPELLPLVAQPLRDQGHGLPPLPGS